MRCSDKLAYRRLARSIREDDRLPLSELVHLLGRKPGSLTRFVDENIPSLAANDDLYRDDCEFVLTLGQALALIQIAAPRDEQAATQVRLAFMAKQLSDTGHDVSELRDFTRNLGDIASTALGLWAFQQAVNKLAAS